MQMEGAGSASDAGGEAGSISARALGSDQGHPLTEHLLTGDSASHPTLPKVPVKCFEHSTPWSPIIESDVVQLDVFSVSNCAAHYRARNTYIVNHQRFS